MRIRAIRGRGLASLGRDFEVDLDAPLLRAAGVFVIGGPTGAGKSTILDAMCLALFDRAPRLASSDRASRGARGAREDGPRAARPGGARRVVIPEEGASAASRDEAEGDAIRASDPRSLVRRGVGQAFAEVDFEGRRGGAFRARWEVRSVRRRDGSRSLSKPTMSLTVLAEPSGTGKPVADLLVEGAREAGRRVGTTKTQVLDEIEARLGLDFAQFCRSVLLPQGELASFLEAPDDERARLLERITGTEIYSTLSRVVHERASLLAREARDRSIELEALPLLDDVARASLGDRRAEATLGVARAAKRLADLARSERFHEETLLHAAELAQAERAADELGRQLGLWESRRSEVARAGRLRELRAEREAIRELDRALARVRQEQDTLSAKLASASKELEAVERTLSTEREALASLARDAETLEQGVTAHEEALARLALLAGTDDAHRASARRAELALRDAVERTRDAQKRVEAFERELGELERELGSAGDSPSLEPLARLLRHELRPGEPCAVCGATEHPTHGDAPGSDAGARDVVGIARALDARRRALSRQDALQQEVGRARATLASRQDEHARAEAARAEATAAARASAEARERLRAQIAAEHGEASPASRRAAFARAIEQARSRLDAVLRDRAERIATSERWNGRAAGAAERIDEMERALVARHDALERALAARGLDKADLARGDAISDEELERWAAEIVRLDEHRARLAAIVEERRRRLERHGEAAPEDLVPRDELAGLRRAAEREREEAERERGIADARLAEDDARRVERDRRAETLGQLRAEASTWEALGRLVGSADGKKLRLVVQSMALDALVAHANEQLRVLAPRYTLARRGRGPGATSLALDVIDGELEGSLRATSSLSGGERFLVSLALALGLGTMGAERDDVGSLFIDEGFGSLDEESLEQALEALDALRQAGRQIGVVSHVPRLAERFDVRVEVTPTEAGSSTVRVRTS